EGSQYFHLPKDLILLINGEIATVSQWGSQTDVPIFERLFLGGSNNLCGFTFREVGPQQNGEPIGGNSKARSTEELTFPIRQKSTMPKMLHGKNMTTGRKITKKRSTKSII